ncbi:hypothetical protein BDC45DRAFT_457359, partial [Circinella umbellata]
MREPNISYMSHSRPAVCITSGVYDRRALDCTATVPLINSLTHLAYLTSTSPRIREILVTDGGLERLVRILSTFDLPNDRRHLWKWSLAFQCVVNIGVRGTERIRTRVVEAGAVHILLTLQDNKILVNINEIHNLLFDHLRNIRHSSATRRRSTFPYIKIDAVQRRRNRLIRVPTSHVSVWRDPRTSNIDNLFYREEDILLSLQLLAYLSKYPHIRNVFHSAYEMNVFSLVERFCHWLHAQPVQYWAGVIMRNACRKDETQGGIRRCANMHCGKWEKQQREFAKCRRCRKAKYCSKACQSRAWAEGHRWWCVERPETSATSTATSASNTTN